MQQDTLESYSGKAILQLFSLSPGTIFSGNKGSSYYYYYKIGGVMVV